MIKLVLTFHYGDAQRALKAATQAVEQLNPPPAIYRAWTEEVKYVPPAERKP